MLTYLLSIVAAYRIEITRLERLYRDWQAVAEKRVKLIRHMGVKLDQHSRQETRIDNQLVHVKDMLCTLVHSENESDNWFVVRYLQLSVDLWRELGYCYKGEEILHTIVGNYTVLRDALPHQARKQYDKLERRRRIASQLACTYCSNQHMYRQAQARGKTC